MSQMLSQPLLLLTFCAQPPAAFPNLRLLKCQAVRREVKNVGRKSKTKECPKGAKFKLLLHLAMFFPAGGCARLPAVLCLINMRCQVNEGQFPSLFKFEFVEN